MRLSILTITRCERHTPRFFTHFRALADILQAEFVVAYDRCEKPDCGADRYVPVEAKFTCENVLAEAHSACAGDYVLRLDDDETLSPQGILCVAEAKLDGRVFAFPRANLWGDEHHAIASGDLFPDCQTRLMPRERETRTQLHAGVSADLLLNGMILHHKFLVKGIDERRAIAARYEANHPGGGTGHYLQFSVPEDAFDGKLTVFPFVSGRVEP